MDPASIVGIVSSVVGIADVVTRSIRSLNSLKTKYRDTPLIVSTLIGQLFTTQVALQQLSSWAEDYPRKSAGSEGGRYPELVAQVGSALDCFGPLVVSLQRDLDQFEGSNKTSMSFTRRMSFLWNERDLNDYLGLLDRQVNALTLLLQAIQCKTQDQQRELLAEKESQTVLRRARDCRSSLVGFDEITGNDGNDGTSIVSEELIKLRKDH
ncbi:hypothetical protein EV356DRAFT_502558 [Viridothelium virens]|uniref:Fungal N-terminal domain-containing protein n=1 Tax=Viridothelium virens TaxID=1048519 RepID=A0A6A6H801_VIRVR|nr:hypothetical protein EV356DRAFT_502558 [Viridothelium virens]